MKPLNVLIILSAVFIGSASAQPKKSKSIIITEKDTIVNGKRLSEADNSERLKLRKGLKDVLIPAPPLHDRLMVRPDLGLRGEIVTITGDDTLRLNGRKLNPGMRFRFRGDTSMIAMKADSLASFHKRFDALNDEIWMEPQGDISIRIPNAMQDLRELRFNNPGRDFRRKPNSQMFSFDYIDKDGISNAVNISVTEVPKVQFPKALADQSATESLNVQDLTLFPNFNSGKMTLALSVRTKGNTTIRLFDSSSNTVFSDQFGSGDYLKQINMLKNGIYFLQVKQGKASFVRRIVKDQD
jgi:hypothetical protein